MRTKEMWKEILVPFNMTRGEIKINYHNSNGASYQVFYDLRFNSWHVSGAKVDKRSYTWMANDKIPMKIQRELVQKAIRKLEREWKYIKEGKIS